jgi:hypothetical protein
VTEARFVSRLTRDTLALVLAGGRGSRLAALTDWRAKPAVPFGGKFRIIDFPLSNCLNSGVRRVAVLTQYKSHSLGTPGRRTPSTRTSTSSAATTRRTCWCWPGTTSTRWTTGP